MTHNGPQLKQFRIELQDSGLVHLVFDMPGRTMNVFSNEAIRELTVFGAWLADSDVRGVVIRSGKDTAFCAGADLTELGVAYDMIMKTPPNARFNTAFDHFFQLSAAIRALETSGKPIAAAIAGLALGGGCELALGAHYRVLVEDPRAALGLPESLVGLLPGAGGTQRLPRLIGVDAALPILLEGTRMSGEVALETGLVDALVTPGGEVAAAEIWLLSAKAPKQPWDRMDWTPALPLDVSAALAPVRRKILSETLGHYPAPLAILDCVECGLIQCFDGAIRSEMAIFSHLIQRAEARNMIQTLFLGRTDYERLSRKSQLPAFVAEVVATVRAIVEQSTADFQSLAAVGFDGVDRNGIAPVRVRSLPGIWVESEVGDPRQTRALAILERISDAISPWATGRSPEELRIADYAVVREAGYPAYLGGPFAFGASRASRESPQL